MPVTLPPGNNRNCRCRLFGGQRWWSSPGENDVNIAPDEFRDDFGRTLAASLREAILDCDGAAVDPAEFA